MAGANMHAHPTERSFRAFLVLSGNSGFRG
jgi:hypothetical protein